MDDLLEEMLSGHYLDFMLAELLAGLPGVAQDVGRLGPAGLVLQARPSNTINALTVPTRDGVVIVYNLGFYSMLYSMSAAVAMVAMGQAPAADAVEWLSGMADWATSLAQEPRITTLALDDDQKGLATNIAAQGQRFCMWHELGHVVALRRSGAPSLTVPLARTTYGRLRSGLWARSRDRSPAWMTLLGDRAVNGSPQELYKQLSVEGRRAMNQAVFKQLLIDETDGEPIISEGSTPSRSASCSPPKRAGGTATATSRQASHLTSTTRPAQPDMAAAPS